MSGVLNRNQVVQLVVRMAIGWLESDGRRGGKESNSFTSALCGPFADVLNGDYYVMTQIVVASELYDVHANIYLHRGKPAYCKVSIYHTTGYHFQDSFRFEVKNEQYVWRPLNPAL